MCAELQSRVAVQQQLVLQCAEAHKVSSAGREAADVAVSELHIAHLRRRPLAECPGMSSCALGEPEPALKIFEAG